MCVMLQWCYSGVTEVLQWCHSSVTVGSITSFESYESVCVCGEGGEVCVCVCVCVCASFTSLDSYESLCVCECMRVCGCGSLSK
jgi:hypothetical protein